MSARWWGQADETILFENLCGYPDYRLVDQLFVNRQAQARVLGCEPSHVVQRLAEVLRLGPKPLREVGDARCQARVLMGTDIDLSLLPIVRHTDIDPYPYTTSFAVHRDPETGEYNQMFPRCGVLSRNEMVASFVTPTANRILNKHRAAGTRMPQAVVIGTHPAWELAGCYSHPHDGWWEMELFESITGSPGEVVKCKTVDLVVPADACIVIEGFLSPYAHGAGWAVARADDAVHRLMRGAAAGVRGDGDHHERQTHLSQSPDDAVHRSSGDASAVPRGHPIV